MATRSSTTCPIFGNYSRLKENVLPTYEDVMKCFLYKRFTLKEKSKKDPSAKDISNELAGEIEDIWNKASLPCVTKTRIVQLIMDYHLKYRTLLKQMKGRKDTPSYKERCKTFQQAGKKLFDICSCKCSNLSVCNCPKDRKVPALEHDFLSDQRGRREMFIGGSDKETTEKNIMRSARKSRLDDFYSKKVSSADEIINTLEAVSSNSSSDLETETDTDEDFCPHVVKENPVEIYQRNKTQRK